MEGLYKREPPVFASQWGTSLKREVRLEGAIPWQERVAYGTLILFIALVYLAPGTLHPALEDAPIAKVVAMLSFFFLFWAKRVKGEAWRVTDKTSLALIAFTLVNGISIADALWREYALFAFLNALKMVGVYFLITQLISTPQRVRQVIWTLLLTAIVPAAGTLGHYLLKIDLVEGYRGAWVGVFADPNDMAYNLVVLIPLALALFETESSILLKGLLLSQLTLFLVAIYVTFSRGGLVGLMAVIFFQVLRSHRRALNFAVCGLMMVLLLALAPASYWERAETIINFRQDESAMGRIYAWRAGIAMLEDRPLLGVGFGCFVLGWPIYAPGDAGTKWRAPHNTFVEVMGETGLLGSVAFFAFMWTTLRGLQKFKRKRKSASPPLFQSNRFTGVPKSDRIVLEKREREDFYARAIEIALWGFLACSLTLGVVRSWPPFILVGLAVALQMMWKEKESEHGKRGNGQLIEPKRGPGSASPSAGRGGIGGPAFSLAGRVPTYNSRGSA